MVYDPRTLSRPFGRLSLRERNAKEREGAKFDPVIPFLV